MTESAQPAPDTQTQPVSENAYEHARDAIEFIAASPSSYHAVAEAARRLEAEGFTAMAENADWAEVGAGRFYVIRDGALIAWVTPDGAGAQSGFRILGAHTDSPGFKLKPHPAYGAAGWQQVGVEIYGGPLINSWLDRELCLAGRLSTTDGREYLTHTPPVARIPQLAIHLDRGANEGLTLNKQQHTQPIIGSGAVVDGDVFVLLAEHAQSTDGADLDPGTIAGHDVFVADTQRGQFFGAEEEFLAAGRLDNLSSVHAGLSALLASEPTEHIAILAAFDHEELGSNSRSGASGPFLADLLTRINAHLGGGTTDFPRAIADSVCLSADAGHLVHPNYVGHHDPMHRPVPGGGPLLKINANQRYATDSVGSALWNGWCADAGVPTQPFVSNNTVPCGSTIGPLTATRLGMRTIDVGVGLLSMHSAREMCQVEDLYGLRAAIGKFFG